MTEIQTLFYKMMRIRMAEEEISRRYPEGKMRCPVHLSVGQESPAVGLCAALTDDDKMVSTHRGHAHLLAKGGSLKSLLAELYGRVDGSGRGFSGSMHTLDRSVGFAGATSIVGGTIPVGVGIAFAKRLLGEPGVAVVCIGDAAIEEGVFSEAANFAGLHSLPVIFFLENNLYSCFTHVKDRQPDRSLFHVAQAHGLGFAKCGGENVQDVKRWADQVRRRAETQPQLFVVDTYRFYRHCGPGPDDELAYRAPEEISAWLAADPLKDWHRYLTPLQILEIGAEINEAFDFAENSPFPEPSELGVGLYANS